MESFLVHEYVPQKDLGSWSLKEVTMLVHVTPTPVPRHQHMKWSSSILHSVIKHESDSKLALGTRDQAWTRHSMPAKGLGGGVR